ncbi:hypothetical protein [Streptomyces yerevanensis]|uniref:hypothetical protein n=1 Tax=Streptomyces yerevanensis TaxID=66378 RepID=UPI0005244C3B|nr:hypothetical protein [Streptomyces yerevanensis]
MRDKPFVHQQGSDAFSVRFVGAQRDLVKEALLWIIHRREADATIRVWAGCNTARLERLYERVKGADQNVFSIEELHVLHAVLLSLYSVFVSEEDFHIKIGFYRENALALANGLVKAVGNAMTETG